MARCTSIRTRVVAAAFALLEVACTRETPPLVRVGNHALRFAPPHRWEHLDHGRQQLFRNGDAELLLEDLGPATPAALTQEFRECERLWLAGRHADALARMNTLHGPPIDFMPSSARADFWRPWTDATYASAADDPGLDRAFEAMIHNAEALPPAPTDNLVEYVLNQASDASRREISRREWRVIHGSKWLSIATWNRVTHTDERRVAFVDDRGYLLYLSTERGLIDESGDAFDSLLTSIEVLPTP